MESAQWIDVGSLLAAAREDMQVGQLLHGEAFSLFEAMSALEVGNPKMDAAAATAAAAEPPSLAALLADPAAAPLDLPAPLLLAVLDRLAALEASWQCGGSAMQTVYSCLYMMNIDRLEAASSSPSARVLAAYCRALQCDCAAVRDLVMAGGVAEEEDINVLTMGLPFEPPAGAAGERVAAALEGAMAAAGELATAAAGGDAALAGELAAALRCRLALRGALHGALRDAVSTDPQVVRGAVRRLAEARQLLALVRQSAALGEPHLGAAPSFHPDANRHLLGPAPPRQVQLMSFPDALSYMERLVDHLTLAAAAPEHIFDYRSLQLYLWRFARQSPPPGVVARSLLHLLITPSHWQAPSTEGQQQQQPAEQVAAAAGSGAAAAEGSKGGGGKGGSKGQGKGKGGKGQGAAAAAGLGTAAGGAAGTEGGAEPAWVPSKAMISKACQVPYKAGSMPEEAEMFFEQAVIAFSNWCQALLMNRCRCRRRLRRCLDDWANMYHHGVNADVVPAVKDMVRAAGWRWRPLDGAPPDDDQGPLGTWVEYETCGTILHHLLMGFPLELYEPKEYDMIYWYCDYVCTSALQAFSALVQRRPPQQPPKMPQPQQQAAAGGRGLGGRGLGGKGLGGKALGGAARDPAAAAAAAAEEQARWEKSQAHLRHEVLELEVVQLLSQGMLRAMAGLRVAGCLPAPPPLPFNTPLQRFEQRFAAMQLLPRPAPLSHNDYVASMDPGDRGAPFLMALAGAAFKEARARCGQLLACCGHPDVAAGWVRPLERLAGVNAVAAGVLAAKLAAGEKVTVSYEWTHPYFPTLVLPKAAPAAAPSPSTSTTSSSPAPASSTTSSAPAPPAPAANGTASSGASSKA